MTISYISQASASAATVTMPTHQGGDYILLWAFRAGSTTLPDLSSGFTQIVGGAGPSCSGYAAYKIAAPSSEPDPVATNASGVAVLVYRGVTGIGGNSPNSGTSNSLDYPALTLTTLNGSSWGVRFGGDRTATNMPTNAPTTTPNTIRTSTTIRVVGIDSNSGLTADITAGSQSVNTNTGWLTVTLELLGAAAANPGQFFAMF